MTEILWVDVVWVDVVCCPKRLGFRMFFFIGVLKNPRQPCLGMMV